MDADADMKLVLISKHKTREEAREKILPGKRYRIEKMRTGLFGFYTELTGTTTTAYEMRIVPVRIVAEDAGPRICTPVEVVKLLETIKNQPQEHFVAISLNGAGQVMKTRIITVGLLNHSLVHPREVFRGAILDNAASIIVAHNHPSGSLEPSSQDLAITTQLKEAGAIIGIQLNDHIIVTKEGHVSLRERGMI
jgi:DNA repair protein RadC